MGKKKKILIVEDDPIIAEDVSMMVEEMGYVCAGIAHDQDSAIELISNTPCDAILLDINLEDAQEGLDIGAFIHKNLDTPFLYTTSFSDKQTINKAKYTEPAAYIIKPIDERDLMTNLEIALFKDQNKVHKGKKIEGDSLFIKDGTDWHKVKYSDVMFLEASDNYTIVHTLSKRYTLSKTLKTIQDQLPSEWFIRVHKSYIVHKDHISKIEEGYLKVGDKGIAVGRSYKNDLFAQLNTLR